MLFLLGSALAAPHPLIDRLRAHLNEESPDTCLTGLVEELRIHAEELTVEERAFATTTLTPWKHDFIDPVVPLRAASPTNAAPPDGEPTEPCFSIGANRITSAHFAVEWDTGSSRSDAQGFLAALEDGYESQVNTYGWDPPMQISNYLVLAYIADGNYASAYTTIESCGPGGEVPYIVAYEGSFYSDGWSDTMAVHELNHALQFGYGSAWEFWWWEATATYVESLVYPDAGEWWGPYVDGYTNNPHIALAASDQNDDDVFWHMYGMAILAFYLDEYQDGPDTVRATWEIAEREPGYYTFGIEDALDAMELDYDAIYLDFIARNAAMEYAYRTDFPTVELADEIGNLPAEGGDDRDTRPQGYGQNYIRFKAGIGDGDLHVTFSSDELVDWAVLLVEVHSHAVVQVVEGAVTDGAADLTLSGFGEDDVYLVVSPLSSSDDDHSYEWTAEVVTPPAILPDEEGPAACGCDTRGGVGGAAGILLGLAALLRRRPNR